MECRELEKFLQVYLDGELDGDDSRMVERHLESCPHCRARAEYERRFVRALKARLPREKAPEQLRQRVAESLAAAGRQARWQRRLLLGSLPAAAALAAIVVMTWTLTSGFSPLVEEAVRQHSQEPAVEIDSSDQAVVENWFRHRVDFHVALPRFNTPSMSLMGARLSQLARRQAALIRYASGGERYSLFVLDDPGLEPSGASCRQLGQRKVCLSERQGYTVLVWRSRGLVYSLVGDAPPKKMFEVVSLESF